MRLRTTSEPVRAHVYQPRGTELEPGERERPRAAATRHSRHETREGRVSTKRVCVSVLQPK